MLSVVSARGAVALPTVGGNRRTSPRPAVRLHVHNVGTFRAHDKTRHQETAAVMLTTSTLTSPRRLAASSSRRPTDRGVLQVAASYNREQTDVGGQQVNPPPSYPPAPMNPQLGWGSSPGRGPPPPPPQTRGGGKWWQKLTSPAVIIGAALVLSLSNPGYIDSTREMILFRLYEKGARPTPPPRGERNPLSLLPDSP